MGVSIAAQRRSQDGDLEQLLLNWRNAVLKWLSSELTKSREAVSEAEDGLRIAAENPGAVDQDVIEIFWDRLEVSSMKRNRLEYVGERIAEMTFAELLVLFKYTKRTTHWLEGARWQFPAGIF